MPNLITLLDRLNRKERYALVGQALGKPEFAPDGEFVTLLGTACGVSLSEPEDGRCWMDYHIDWLYAAVVLSKANNGRGPYLSPEFISATAERINVNTNQEDCDLLVAVETAATTHLFMVEAKWQTAWSAAQVDSKIRRLTHIFGEDGARWPEVTPHFVLASTANPKHLLAKLKASGATGGKPFPPSWVLVNGELARIRLSVPTDRITIHRCDEQGNHDRTGMMWTYSDSQSP